MFFSTRDPEQKLYPASQVIKQGLANDGGLFVPDSIPTITLEQIAELADMSYPEKAATILSKFIPPDHMLRDVNAIA